MQLRINFYPEHDDPILIKVAQTQHETWLAEGGRIVEVISSYTGLNFIETEITAVITYQASFSHPLVLYYQAGKGRLIHELLHRLFVGNDIEIPNKKLNPKLEIHKVLNLVLYDIWDELYGEEFANNQVEIESKFGSEAYVLAWKYALSLSSQERKEEFQKIIQGKV